MVGRARGWCEGVNVAMLCLGPCLAIKYLLLPLIPAFCRFAQPGGVESGGGHVILFSPLT